MVRIRRHPVLPSVLGANPAHSHQPGEAVLGHGLVWGRKSSMNSRTPIGSATLGVDRTDLDQQALIGFGPRAHRSTRPSVVTAPRHHQDPAQHADGIIQAPLETPSWRRLSRGRAPRGLSLRSAERLGKPDSPREEEESGAGTGWQARGRRRAPGMNGSTALIPHCFLGLRAGGPGGCHQKPRPSRDFERSPISIPASGSSRPRPMTSTSHSVV